MLLSINHETPAAIATLHSFSTGFPHNDQPNSRPNWTSPESEPQESDADKACKICSGKSTGVHYGVASCEGCKAFFKRAVLKNAQFRCFFGGTCDIGFQNKPWCKGCRFQRCLQAGMVMESNGVSRLRKTVTGHFQLLDPLSGSDDVPAIYPKKSCTDSTDSDTPESLSSSRTSVITRNEYVSVPWCNKMRESYLENGAQRFAQRSPISLDNDQFSQTSVTSDSSVATLTGKKENSRGTFREMVFLNSSKILLNPESWRTGPTVYRKIYPGADIRNQHPMWKYYQVMEKRTRCHEDTIRVVMDIVGDVYGDQIELWSDFMGRALEKSYVKPPEISVETMKEVFFENCGDEASRLNRFIKSLPGYDELDQKDKDSRVITGGFESWLLHHARYFHNGQSYYLTHHHRYHYSRHWMEALFEADFVGFIFSFMKQINSIGMTLTEIYVLMAVAVLRPEDTSADSPTYLSFLYAHYLDALTHLFVSRNLAYGRSDLDSIISRFKVTCFLNRNYVQCLDMTKTPFLCSTGEIFRKVKDRIDDSLVDQKADHCNL